jgi:carbamoyl-phosphate synthase large subunit
VKRTAVRDSYAIRRAALQSRITVYTTLAGARAAWTGMQESRDLKAYDLQGLHVRIAEKVH